MESARYLHINLYSTNTLAEYACTNIHEQKSKQGVKKTTRNAISAQCVK